MTDKILIERSVVEQALEGLIMGFAMYPNGGTTREAIAAAIKELRASLKQPQVEQEPVAWCELDADRRGIAYFDGKPIIMTGPAGNEHHPDPLYTHPQPPRQPLTDEQIFDACESTGWIVSHGFAIDLARGIEAAHGIKEQK